MGRAANPPSPEIFKPWLDSDLGHLLYSDHLAVGGRNTSSRSSSQTKFGKLDNDSAPGEGQ